MVHQTCSLAKRRFHTFMRQMKLKSTVKTSRKLTQQAPCIADMASVMRCWKSNNFSDVPCMEEIKLFKNCLERAKAQSQTSIEGLKKDGRYNSSYVNERLKMFDSPR